jgi:hypothetical protein
MPASKKQIGTIVHLNAIKNRRKTLSDKNKQRKNQIWDPKKMTERTQFPETCYAPQEYSEKRQKHAEGFISTASSKTDSPYKGSGNGRRLIYQTHAFLLCDRIHRLHIRPGT